MLTKVKGSVWDSVDNGLAVNINDYKHLVVGDDWTVAIQAAIDGNNGKTLYVPDGTFMVSDVLNLTSTTTVSWTGTGTLKSTTTAGSGGTGVGHSILNYQGCSDFFVEGITLDNSAISTFLSATRCLTLDSCDNYRISGTYGKTSGAFTAATQCSNYTVYGNRITISSSDGVAHHDGVIDQWWGSNNFTIVGNTIDGASIARYPILVTGESTAGAASGCSNFTISSNKINNCLFTGIWVNGREGINTDFAVTGNVVDTVSDFHGISISDCVNGTVSGNTVRNTEFIGINLYEETSAGGVTGAQNISVTGNTVINANLNGSVSDATGSAIVIQGANSKNCTVVGNITGGSTHRRAIQFASGVSNCGETGNIDSGATQTPVINDTSGTNSNKITGGTFTSTTTNVTNVTSSSVKGNYSAQGDECTFFIEATIQSTASGACTLRFTLPLSSTFTLVDDAFGNCVDAFGNTAIIQADTVNNELELQIQAGTATTYVLRGSVNYKIK